MDANLLSFANELKSAFNSDTFKKLVLSKPLPSEDIINRVQIKMVVIKREKALSFSFEYPTKNITKNYSVEEAVNEVIVLIDTRFKNAVLFTEKNDIRFSFNKKMKSSIEFNKPTCNECVTMEHNNVKERLIQIENNVYLKELGVVTKNNQIAQNMQRKYKQINKYIETIDSIIEDSILNESEEIKIVDMGAGKGYLTFALYDYLNNVLNKKATITGVEIREELVTLCNEISNKCNYANLNFYKGDIESYKSDKIDILIALHACDTATDDAIYQGIKSNSSIIVTAPCCHKQIRQEMEVEGDLKLITKHGILLERQAEIVTDTLRGLLLEAYGYKTQIFEFIADAHTHKNVMIVGVKKLADPDKKGITEKIQNLKTMFGIKNFHLENLLNQ
ncbi:MAG: SAM-dependent methyltransferase [Salinivirgaceae bacterium]|nr:SAM-dependent methyltransferase [Salinivirgaceae bacterium]MDD4747694.1 SAM-dependent methyltransferase [Salinivirgaceae bacterium]